MDQIAVPRSIDGLPEAALAADCEPSFLFWRRLDYAERRFGAAALATTLLRRNDLATMTRPDASSNELNDNHHGTALNQAGCRASAVHTLTLPKKARNKSLDTSGLRWGGDFAPCLDGRGQEGSVRSSCDEMALDVECVVDRGVD